MAHSKFQPQSSRRGKTFQKEISKNFGKNNDYFSTKVGCYVGMRAGKGITPMYVGKATKSFKQEVFAHHKLTKYLPALATYKTGTPILFLLRTLKRMGK